MDRWVGKTAVVTGASVGIGAALAVALADAGVNVVGLARRPHLVEALNKEAKAGKCKIFGKKCGEARKRELNKEVKAGKGKIYGKKCDVSSREEIIKVFAEINEQFGGFNIVVNNAARMKFGTFTDEGRGLVSDDDIEMQIMTNTLGLVTCSREGAKYIKQTGEQGHIINISSLAGHYVPAALGQPMFNIYYGTKHALEATTEAMRLEFSHAKTNIKITSVSPGGVRTELVSSALDGKEVPVDLVAGGIDSFPMLEAIDVAEAVMSVIATPPRVNISQVIIRPLGDTM